MKRFLYVLFCTAILYACNKDTAFDCVKSTGAIQQEERSFSNFNTITVNDNINLILVNDLDNKIIVEAGKNLLPKIKSTHTENILTLENTNTCNWVRDYDVPINVFVGLNQVKKIIQNGYGKITSMEALTTDTLRVHALQFGSVNLSLKANYIGVLAEEKVDVSIAGSANKLDCQVFGNADVNLSGVQTSWTYIQNKSDLPCYVYTDSLLQAKIKGKGAIKCYGNPVYIEYTQQPGNGELLIIP